MTDPRIAPYLQGLKAMTDNAERVAVQEDIDNEERYAAEAAADALGAAYQFATWCLR